MSFDCEITSELVIGLWDHMEQHFGSKTVSKADAQEMTIIASALEKMGVLDAQDFLDRFATTLGNTIYIPFEVGKVRDDGAYRLKTQVRLCVHEHQHVVQAQREGLPKFAFNYLADSALRAGYEAEAFGCNLELEWFLTGKLIDPEGQAQSLRNYKCTAADIAFCAKELSMRSKTVKLGGVANEASKVAISWLKGYAAAQGG